MLAKTTITAATVVLLAACGGTDHSAPELDVWCEYDLTDERVPDQHCLDDEFGYEWEPDSDDGVVVVHKNVKKTVPKTTVKTTTITKSATKTTVRSTVKSTVKMTKRTASKTR